MPTKTSDLSNDSGYITNEALDDYATKAELPTKVSQLENDSKFINESALDGYAKTDDIPTKTSQINNDSGYITANDVPVKSVDGATGDVVTNAVKTTAQTLTDAQKQQARANIGAGTSSFDGDYNSLTNKPTIPTKTSDITNDSGFITEDNVPVKSVNGKTGDVTLDAKSVGALPDTTVVPSKTSELDNDSGFITDAALTGYAKTTDIPTKTSQLENDSHYITANEAPVTSVNSKTGAVQLNASDVGALPDTTVIPTKTSQLDNDSGFISDIPIASTTQLGGVKIGAGLSVTENGILSATGGGTADTVEWNNVLDKPTTIAGYGITDAKIENGTITLGNQTITPLTSAPVTSVNSKTGAVVLTQDDVGDGTTYVRTHNDFTDALKAQINTNKDNIAMAESDIDGLKTTVGTLQTNVNNVQTQLDNKQPTITVNGIIKGDGAGGVTAAEAGTDYATPSLGITGAAVGQAPTVKTIDEQGKPTEWEPATLAKADGSNIPIRTSVMDTWRTRIAALPGIKVYGKADANGKIKAYTDAACTQEVTYLVQMALVDYDNALLIYDHKTYQCVGFEEPASMQGSGNYLVAVFFRSEIATDSAGAAVLKVETAKLNVFDYQSGTINMPITITAGELPLTTTTTT